MTERENQFTQVSSSLHTCAVLHNLLPQYINKSKKERKRGRKKTRWCVIEESSSYLASTHHTYTHTCTHKHATHTYITRIDGKKENGKVWFSNEEAHTSKTVAPRTFWSHLGN